MAIMTARQGQHDLIQFLKNPKVRERHFVDSALPENSSEKDGDQEDPQKPGSPPMAG